jgi:hypothetical protein
MECQVFKPGILCLSLNHALGSSTIRQIKDWNDIGNWMGYLLRTVFLLPVLTAFCASDRIVYSLQPLSEWEMSHARNIACFT